MLLVLTYLCQATSCHIVRPPRHPTVRCLGRWTLMTYTCPQTTLALRPALAPFCQELFELFIKVFCRHPWALGLSLKGQTLLLVPSGRRFRVTTVSWHCAAGVTVSVPGMHQDLSCTCTMHNYV